MIFVRILALPILLALFAGCDSSCDDLQKALCSGPKGQAAPDCKVVLDEAQSDALTDDTCQSILDSMRE